MQTDHLISSVFFVCQMSTSVSCLPAFTSVRLKGCFYICLSQGVFFTSLSLKGCFYICLPQGVRGCPTALGQEVCDGTLPTAGQFPSHPPDDFVGLAVCLWAGADGLAGRCQKLQAFLQVYGAVLSHGIPNDFGWNQWRLSIDTFGQYVRCKESMKQNPFLAF